MRFRNICLGALAAIAAMQISSASAQIFECSPLMILAELDIITDDQTGAWAFPVVVNGTTKYFMAANGRRYSSINKSVVEELSIPTTAGTQMVMNFQGERLMRDMARPESLLIGNLVADHIPLQVDLGQGPDGMIGGDILRNYDVEVDFTNRKFFILDQDHCEGEILHWQATALDAVPMETTPTNSQSFIRVEVNGVALDALVSLASAQTAMNLTVARQRLGVDLDSENVEELGVVQSGGRSGTRYLTRFESFSIGGYTLPNMEIVLEPDLLARSTNVTPTPNSLINRDSRANLSGIPDITLGMSILRNFHVYMAYGENRLYLTPALRATEQ